MRVDLLPRLFELQAAAEHLDAQVVFLVDHDGDGLVLPDGHAARAFGGGVLLADQVPLDEQLAVDLRGVPPDRRRASCGDELRAEQRVADAALQRLPLLARCAGEERQAGRRCGPGGCARR